MTPEIYAGLPAVHKFNFSNKILISEPNMIIDCVCSVLEVERKHIMSGIRVRPIVEARHICIGIISETNPNITLKKIGAMFGGLHHSTVLHSKFTFADLYEVDKKYREKVDKVKKLTHLY